ncbi:ABC transporter substrate-binding protein [Desulfovibrio inopinatus]|uniref:ABC transporter substrate-binding protein n=1 Tax=Desulfovibrio inopinatus TaxID=102109 RepID=UPI0004217451|nr:ABC transporter substrate-binding protein [Desulfovibrio inopinatus]
MKAWNVILLLAIIGLAVMLYKSMDPSPRHFRIGIIQFTSNNLETLDGFKAGMEQYGYIEGKNITYLFDGPVQYRKDIIPKLQIILAQKPDILFASTTPAAKMAKELTANSGIAVVFAPVNDPVSSGIIQNLQRPEGNVTGIRLAPSEGRRLMALCELVPSIKKVFVPYNPKDASAAASLRQLREAAPKLGVTIVAKPFTTKIHLATDTEYIPQGIDAIFMPREGLVMSHWVELNERAKSLRIPLSTPRFDQVEHGVLTGYGFVGADIGKQAARLAHLILAGTPVAKLPVETAQDSLFINLETAAAINLVVPVSFLRRAREIIRSTTP